MKKLILILLFFTGFLQAQTLQNPTYGNTTTNTLKIKTPGTVTSVNFLSTNEADGSISKIAPINITIPYTPVNYIVSGQSIGQHLAGIDAKLTGSNGILDNNVFQKQIFNTSTPIMVTSTTTGSFNFSASGLIVSGGNGTFTNLSRLPEYSQLEDYQIESGIFKSTVAGAGIGLGIDCLYNDFSICKADLSSGSGKIYISNDKTSFSIESPTALVFSSTDDLQIILKRTKFSISAYFNNITTGKSVVATYDTSSTGLTISGKNINRIGRPAMWSFGGTQTFSSSSAILYKSYAFQSPVLAIAGTSIEYGSNADNIEKRWVNFKGKSRFSYAVLPGASSTSSDIVNILPEILKVKPQFLAINCVINDAITGVSNSVTQSNIDVINNFCILNNIKSIWITSTPTNNPSFNSNIQINNNYILSLKGVTRFVDMYSQLVSSGVLNTIYDSGDGVHPNALGHYAMAGYFISQTQGILDFVNNFDTSFTQNFTNTSNSANFSGKVGFGNTNPFQPIDVSGNISIRSAGGEGKGLVWTNTLGDNYVWQFVLRPSDNRLYMYNFLIDKTPFTIFSDGKISINSSTYFPSNNNIDQLQVQGSVLSSGYKIPSGTSSQILTADGGTSVAIANTNTSASAATLSSSAIVNYYVFGGTTATWTLPTPASSTTKKISMINAGTGTVTVNTNGGANVLYNGGSTTNTYGLIMGSNVELYSDGTKWIVL